MPPKKKSGSKPSVAKAAKAETSTKTTRKTTAKTPKKVAVKKRAPKTGTRTVAKKQVRSSVSRKTVTKKPAIPKKAAASKKPAIDKKVATELAPAPKKSSPKKVAAGLATAPNKDDWKKAIVKTPPVPPVPPAPPVTAKKEDPTPRESPRTIKFTQEGFIRAGAFVALVIGILVSGFSMKAIAAEFQGPTLPAPGGNIPVTIWNRESAGVKQGNAEIDIDGELQVGNITYEPASDAAANNLIYGVAHYYDYATGTYHMNSNDYLMKLQTYYTNHSTSGDFYSTRFSVNRGGSVYSGGSVSAVSGVIAGSASRQLDASNAGQYVYYALTRYDESDPSNYRSHPRDDYLFRGRTRDYDAPGDPYMDRFTVSVDGSVYSAGCFGSTFVGLTGSSFAPSDVSGYYGAHNKCKADYPAYPGVHVCTSQEMLESIKCSLATDPIRAVADGTAAWMHGGPPGFTANTNDCQGWTTSASNSYARYWIFDLASGGKGTTTSCNSPGIQFACCK